MIDIFDTDQAQINSVEPKAGTYHSISSRAKNLAITAKKVSDFPVPSRDVTNQTLPGRE
jgi:hypothetical protein